MQLLLEEGERAAPRQVRGLLVVARRRVVMKSVLRGPRAGSRSLACDLPSRSVSTVACALGAKYLAASRFALVTLLVVMRTALLALLACSCASALPANNASRPIKVAIIAAGDRPEEVQFRLERRVVGDPDVGIGDGGTYAHVELNLGLGKMEVCTEGTCTRLQAEFLPSADDTDRLDELVRWATRDLLQRLRRWQTVARR